MTDRPLIEIMVTIALICTSAISLTAIGAYYMGVAEAVEGLKAMGCAYHLAALILEAASESAAFNAQTSLVFSSDVALVVEAANSTLTISFGNHVESIEVPLLVEGRCSGNAIKITSFPNGTALMGCLD